MAQAAVRDYSARRAPDPSDALSGVQCKGALAAVRGEGTLGGPAQEFDVHPNQITEWKRQSAADVFGTASPRHRAARF
jgi:hypothetical protein